MSITLRECFAGNEREHQADVTPLGRQTTGSATAVPGARIAAAVRVGSSSNLTGLPHCMRSIHTRMSSARRASTLNFVNSKYHHRPYCHLNTQRAATQLSYSRNAHLPPALSASRVFLTQHRNHISRCTVRDPT